MNPYDLVGQRLGDYKITRKIATGGMATIYEGVDEKLGRAAAIKVLTPDVASRDETLTSRFEKEARAIARLEHPHIIPVYQFGKFEVLYFLAMRFVEGDDLGNVIDATQKSGKLFPFDRALNILEHVADALDYAHSKGIVHRDVKPSNVLLSKDDHAYLSDFGLVLYTSGDQTLGTAFGTPRYISPEQATDSQLATAKSDIYSLAVIVYEILTGQRLFKGKTPMEIALSHIADTPTPPRAINPNVSADLQQVVLRSLEKEPAKRHETAKDFVTELRQAYEKSKATQKHPSKDKTLLDVSEGEGPSTISFRKDIADDMTIPPVVPKKRDPELAKIQPTRTSSLDKNQPIGDDVVPSPVVDKKPFWRRGAVIFVAVDVVLIAIVALLAFFSNNSANNTNVASVTNPANNTAQTVSVQGLVLHYLPDVVALTNTSSASLNLSGLEFKGASDASAFVVSSSELPQSLEAGACVLIKSNTPTIDVPADWNCASARQITLNQATLFWRAEADNDQSFTVAYNDKSVTCDTVGRAVGRLDATTCAVE